MKIVIVSISISLLLSACKSDTVINEYRAIESTKLLAEEKIVVLGRRHNTQQETEVDYVDCVGKQLATGDKAIEVIPEQSFVDAMYPYFETSTAPMDVKNLDKLVQNPSIAKKFSDFKVRYFVWLDGYTETTDSQGGISCGAGPGGGGCFGFKKWEDTANYEASIWDFKEVALSGKISTETEGTSYVPAVIIPIPLLARVKSNACSKMAAQIKQFLQ